MKKCKLNYQMKNILILVILLFYLGAHAQLGLAKGELYEKGIIYFKDGTSEEGLIKSKSFGGVKFRESLDSKPQSYDYNDIEGYDITEHGSVKYRYKKVGDFHKIMKVIRLGKMNLYSVFVSNAGTAGAMGLPSSQGNIYYIEKNQKVVNIGSKIRKNEWYLFEDCPILLEKIKKKEFKKYEIFKIVNFYDTKCK
ncbi:hypothetical protein [Thalassobellus sediminis]|uniref:hypothetical protein n=1 Tax=Thalassobellus sediminis TaxID=3367753 RepID=UPI00378BDDE1